MPTLKKGELSKDFLNRCIPQVIKDGITLRSGKKIIPHHKQAIAVCYSMLNSGRKKIRKRKKRKEEL
jgi:hypothetical protein